MREYDNYVSYLNEKLNLPSSYHTEIIDLFAGCGGLSLGFEAQGFKTIGYEMNINSCETYRKNMLSTCYNIKLGVGKQKYPKVPVVIGGPPCQPFSERGLKKGAKDERNGFPVFIDAIRQIKPELWIFENVRGLATPKNKEYLETILSELKSLGYQIDYDVKAIKRYDVPQNRFRFVAVGHKGGFQFPTEREYVVTAGEAVGDLVNSMPENPQFLTPSMDQYIAAYEKASHCARPRDLHMNEPARTLTCRNLAGATSDMHRVKLIDGRRRRITVREAARLQSFPDWFEFYGNEESQFTQIGNAVPPMFAYHLAGKVKEYLESRGIL